MRADITNFSLEEPVDFAFIMMGTISLIESKERFLSHLNCVADSLMPGGLYLIENLRLDWANEGFFGAESWVMEWDGIRVKTTYDIRLKDALSQMLTETMTLEVDDYGRTMVL